MNGRLKPASRLSIVFILAIVLSGSILTWFSINNISNLKELTEKQILEEQRELSARITQELQIKIENVTAGYAADISSTSLLKNSLIKTSANYDYIALPFILKDDGFFLYPNFIGIPKNLSEPKLSSRFKSAFRKGEEAEFAKKNLKTAKKEYLACLSYSTGDNDSVKALNALGRVSVKLNDFEGATNHYNLIILNYFQATTTNSFPYVYYALPQLLKITNPDNCEKILPAVEFCLEGMETGSIPLNFNTEELLILVIKWLEENTFNNPEKVQHINKLEKSINQQLQFINEYGNELSELVKKGGLDNHLTIGNDFKVVNSSAGTNQDLLLINTSFKNPAGFLIDSKNLFDTILKTGLLSGFEFDYIIEFPTGYNTNTSRHKLIYTSQLIPYYPGQLIQIRLVDENLINELIKRRSWIYGIASILLLVAMFLGVALILRDIAREKHLARLRSDFVSNVTHELKTPLTSIHMFAESILMGRVKASRDKNEYLNIILKETERLKRMINNILDFSKREKGMIEYNFKKTDLSALVKSALHDLDYWLVEESFNVQAKIEENVFISVDPDALKQAVINLLSNAIKYSRNTKEIIVILIQEKNTIKIVVEDKGIGIPEDKTELIFDKFYRVGQNKGEETSGTGLGLTVVKEIIEAHKGEILVESKLNKGSKFTIILDSI